MMALAAGALAAAMAPGVASAGGPSSFTATVVCVDFDNPGNHVAHVEGTDAATVAQEATTWIKYYRSSGVCGTVTFTGITPVFPD